MKIGLYLKLTFITCYVSIICTAQPNLEFELNKPKQYEDYKLGSERLAEKKFTIPRHFIQNSFTHYNYYYNANRKLNDIIINAKERHKDDYTKLLPFYNYSLTNTSASSEIDSIIEKCTAGILLHDLRNDWIDNLYLIMGKAYFLKRDFDSAAMTFQYINYAFGPKEKDGYDKVIGSNSNEGSNIFSISTKEKTNLYKKIFERPPSRNESFVWQIRTYIENEQYLDASSLISTLKNDPNFPNRLKEYLAEMEAYNYYQQGIYDSCAKYLAGATHITENATERARRYFLIGQMYHLSSQDKTATDYFSKCVSTTTDPTMEVYGRLNLLRLRKKDDSLYIEKNIYELVKMAKKEKYEFYRDIIYYAAALSELERNGYNKARDYLNKSIRYNIDNPEQRNKSFLLLADIAFATKKYGNIAMYYDSLSINILDSNLSKKIATIKPACKTIYDQEQILNKEDSLLKIASMPETERKAYIKSLVKKLRKEQGLQEEVDNGNNSGSQNPNNSIPDNLFSNSGDFYFYNTSLKSNGFSSFKQKWGSRPNVDNWRRSAALHIGFAQSSGNRNVNNDSSATDEVSNSTEITVESFLKKLPIEKKEVEASNKRVNQALMEKAKALQNGVEDIAEAIKVYELLIERPQTESLKEEILFNLIYCYNKIGDKGKSDDYKKRLNTEYAQGEFISRLNHPIVSEEKSNNSATKKYQEIYNLFIEGEFEKALAEKRHTDSTLGTNYWTPQLLYIESIYYIKQRDDSTAIQKLNTLVKLYANTPLADKSTLLISVLQRRKEIEKHLTELNIPSKTIDTANIVKSIPILPSNTNNKKDTTSNPNNVINNIPQVLTKKDTLSVTPAFTINTFQPQMVAIVLNKVDVVYLNECLNAFKRYNQQTFYNQQFDIQKQKINDNYSIMTINCADFTSIEKNLEYISKVKPKTTSQIIPWLDPKKYSFIIVDQNNLDILKQNGDITGYLNTLKTTLPGQF